MSFTPNRIDPQHLHLDALVAEIHRAREEGVIDDDALDYMYEREPESHVFYGADIDGAYDDPEEAREIIMMVGGRDLDDKIRYWEGVLAAVARGDWS